VRDTWSTQAIRALQPTNRRTRGAPDFAGPCDCARAHVRARRSATSATSDGRVQRHRGPPRRASTASPCADDAGAARDGGDAHLRHHIHWRPRPLSCSTTHARARSRSTASEEALPFALVRDQLVRAHRRVLALGCAHAIFVVRRGEARGHDLARARSSAAPRAPRRAVEAADTSIATRTFGSRLTRPRLSRPTNGSRLTSARSTAPCALVRAPGRTRAPARARCPQLFPRYSGP
jgi:hypothetical protein